MRRIAVLLSFIAACLGLVADSGRAHAQEKTLTVFAAASMKNALDDVNAAFTKATDIKVVASYAASSALMKQIEQGAPADVFASADLEWMDYGAQKQVIKDDTRVNLLGNKLVLIAPKDSQTRGRGDRARLRSRASSQATAASPPATCARFRSASMPSRRWRNWAHGRQRKRNWRWRKTCARR